MHDSTVAESAFCMMVLQQVQEFPVSFCHLHYTNFEKCKKSITSYGKYDVYSELHLNRFSFYTKDLMFTWVNDHSYTVNTKCVYL